MTAPLSHETEFEPTLSYVVSLETGTESPRHIAMTALPGIQVGTILGERYELQQEFGSGGMGTVYAGVDRRLGRRVAVKLIRPDRLSRHGEEMRLAFESEARLGASLLHPAIATVYDYGFHAGTPFAVFEFLGGQSLRDLLRGRAGLPLEDVQTILARLAQGLDYAHQKGIVHRDLKPENIRCDEHGQFKILDLGLAKNFHNDRNWSFAGTPAYASPEQANEVASDGRTDQYALAVIAYEMLSGQRPFQAATCEDMLEKHKSEQAPALSSLMPGLPDSVRMAVSRALSKNPNERFTSCCEFASALGAQFQAVPTADDKVLCTAPVAEAYPKLAVSLRLRNARMQLALQPQRFWIATDTSIESWPVAAVSKVVRSGRALWVTLVEPQRKTSRGFQFRTREVATFWQAQLEKVCAVSPSGEPSRIVEDPVLTAAHPDVQVQVLGRCEAFGTWNADALMALRLKVALQGGNGLVDLVTERLVTPEGVRRRASGTAVRTLDAASRGHLAFRSYVQEVHRTCQWLLLLVFVHLVAHFIGGLMLSLSGPPANALTSLPYVQIGRNVMLYHSVPLALTCLLWLLQPPQLLRSTAIANVFLTLSPYLACLSLVIGGSVAYRSAVPFLGLLLFLDPLGLMIAVAGLTLSRRLWKTSTRFSALLRDMAVPQTSNTRWLESGATAIALLYVLGLTGAIALDGWQISAIDPKDGDFRTALSRLGRIQPGDAEVNQSRAEIGAGQYEAAIATATRAIELNPRSPLGYVNRAAANVNLGRHSDALADADRAVTIDPKCAVAYVNRASAHRGLFHNELALSDAEKAIQLDAAQPLAYINRGFARLALGQFEASLQDAESALRLTPSDGNAYLLRGSTRFKLDRVSSATVDLQQAGRLLKQDYRTNISFESFWAAQRLLAKEELAAAIEAATTSINANPLFPSAYIVRGSATLKQGRAEDALLDAETALSLAADSPFALTLRGDVRLQLDDAQGALDDFNAAITLDPKHISAHRSRAFAHAKLGHEAEADADKKRADELARETEIPRANPKNPE